MKKKLYTATWVTLLVVGVFLISLPWLENSAIKYLTNSEMNGRIAATAKDKNANFDFRKIESVSASSISKAILNGKKQQMIGKIAIPSVKISLPLYYGLNNQELLSGAGTMKADQKLGEGNFAVAGHHMSNGKILFGPLHKVKKNTEVYFTDGKKRYTYRVSFIKTISQYEVHYVTDTYKTPVVTLITCSSGTINEPNRTLVVAKLAKVEKLNNQNAKVFQ